MRQFDVVVVGLGGIGSAAACHLARRGHRVLGLDRRPVPHGRGSSHGQTRLIRFAYYEHPDYVPLLVRAAELWRDLEAVTGRRLLVESGLLTAGPAADDVIAGTLRSAERHGLEVERLTAGEAAHRWPAFSIPEAWTAIHEPRAGHLLVEQCVSAHVAAAASAGATLDVDATVLGWRVAGGGVVVTTAGGDVTADRLVLAPGSWAGGLLELPGVGFTVLRKSLFWFRPPAAAREHFLPGAVPCFAFADPAGFFYGFPALDGRGLKVAEHTGGRVVADPLAVDRALDVAERHRVAAAVAPRLPTLGGELTDHAVCLYTMSPDGHFLVGLHPDHDRVAIAAGFSGHGFKFASVIGEVLADLATAGTTRHPIGFLSPARFGPAG